jgi:hypothetical protein
MNCAEFRARADAYANGSLPVTEAQAFEWHLDGCAACSALLEELERRLEETTVLPRSLEPSADLWPAIQSRLAPRVGRGRVAVPAWLLAAAAVLLVALSSATTALLLRRPSSNALAIQVPSAIAPLEVDYVSATADLGAALARFRTRLAPATIAVIERNLAIIDSALAESRRALARDPGNATLERLVIAAWEQKVDFLRRATALAPEL